MNHDNITVVIPTLKADRANIPTVESVPKDVEILLQHESPIAKARNRGVERARTDYVIQCDDDIRFGNGLWQDVCDALDRRTVVGMADWDFGLIVTRCIGFHRATWAEVGGFDTRLGSHMEDTDFAIKLDKAKYAMEQIEQDRITHIDHDSRIDTKDRAWRLAYLCAKHPRYAPRLIRGMLR